MSMQHQLAIRKATKDDIPLIHDFIRSLAIYEKLEDRHVGTLSDLENTLFSDTPYAHVVIASLDGVNIGFALYFFNYSTFLSRPGLYLEDLFVKEDARGKGVGKALLKHLAKIATEKNCGRMEWQALDWNTPAIDFYTSKTVGAKCMSEWKSFRLEGEDLISFAKS